MKKLAALVVAVALLASGVAGAADKFLMPPAGMNTLRFQNGITIEIPDNWILLQSKINLFNAARHDDKGNAFAFLIIQKINASLPVTHDDIRKMSDSVKKNFLDSFVESYQKSQNMSSEIQDRKILASDIIELNGFTTIIIISSGIINAQPVIIETKTVALKDGFVQLTYWCLKKEFEKNIKEFVAIGESFIPGTGGIKK